MAEGGGPDVFGHCQHLVNAYQLQFNDTVTYDVAVKSRTQKDQAVNPGRQRHSYFPTSVHLAVSAHT